ncbi:MAG TPA: PspA/IM30 family protein [Candidatus Dormibacteraeota bacterium]|nr:PspA/IM30 family protein [Candidatus Dormibacteraeota bacterium]
MSVWSRVRMLFNAEMSSTLDKAEDPRTILDYAYNQQQELLMTLRRGLVDVATAKQQLEQEAKRLEQRIPQLDDQARRAVAANREDLARVAVERKWLAANEIEGLNKQIAEVEAEKQRLAGQERRLQVRVEQFRTHREVVVARYTAAEAEVRIKESLAGVSGELAELGMAVGRAEEKAERLQARARAIDSLVDLGSFPPVGGGDFVEAELLRVTVTKEIDAELERIKKETKKS